MPWTDYAKYVDCVFKRERCFMKVYESLPVN